MIKKSHTIIIGMLFIALIILIIPTNHDHKEQNKTYTITSSKAWIPTQIVNDIFGSTTSYYYTGTEPNSTIPIAYPYRAKTVIYTIYVLNNEKTITGSAVYNNYNNKVLANDTEYYDVIKLIARIQTLTANEFDIILSNQSVTISDSVITLNYTNTYAILTLVDPDYNYTYFEWPILTADLRLFSPLNDTTHTTYPQLPNIAGKSPAEILSRTMLILPYPGTVNAQIIIFYETSTFMEILALKNIALYNKEYLTLQNLTAFNPTITVTLTKLTNNPIYSLPKTLNCSIYPNDVYECMINNTTVYFNKTAISYRYTFVTNNITLTEVGWFIFLNTATPVKTVTINT